MAFRRPRSTTVSSALMATALLGACENSAPDASIPEQSPSPSDKATLELPQPAGSSSTSGLADIPHSEQRLCRFEVDGKVLVDGRCEVFPMGDGGYTLNTAGKPSLRMMALQRQAGTQIRTTTRRWIRSVESRCSRIAGSTTARGSVPGNQSAASGKALTANRTTQQLGKFAHLLTADA